MRASCPLDSESLIETQKSTEVARVASSGDVVLLTQTLEAMRDTHCEDPEFIYWDAVLDVQCERKPEAIAKLQHCLELAPDAPAPAFTLARLFVQSEQLERAAQLFEQSIQNAPEHSGAWLALAQVRARQGELSRAEFAYRQVLELQTDNITAVIGLAHVLEAQKQWQVAIEFLRPFSANVAVESQLIRLHVQHAPADQTQAYLMAILAAQPNHVQAKHLLGGLLSSAQSERASDAYVRELFDGYASRYDQHMTEQMGYVVPELVANRVNELARITGTELLDLGCGTGLIGALLPQFVNTGVDLSQAMLDLAVGRNYQQLIAQDINSYLSNSAEQRFDFIVAGDTLIYFGTLDDIFRQSWRCLRASGYLIFNVELSELADWPVDFQQTPVGRYTHAPSYLQARLEQAGFVEIVMQPIMPRREGGVEMAGLMVSAQRR